MSDYDQIAEQFTSNNVGSAVADIDQNPDNGARALALSRATGAGPQTIYNDLDGFERDHRQSLTSAIVRGNPALSQYLYSNPLASVVSNDDYGNLDTFSKSASLLSKIHDAINPSKFIQEPIVEGLKGAAVGAAQGFASPPLNVPDNYNIASKAAWELVGAMQ